MRKIAYYEKLLRTSKEQFAGFFLESSGYLVCIQPLVKLLGWSGDARTIAEKFPHFSYSLTQYDFLKVMEQLNFRHRRFSSKLDSIDSRLYPCLMVLTDDRPILLLEKTSRGVIVFDSKKNKVILVSKLTLKGDVFLFDAIDSEDKKIREKESSWFGQILRQHKSLLWQVFLMSLLSGLLSLSVPIFIMSVFDRVVSTESISMLSSFIVGLCIALLGMWILSIVKIKMLARIGQSLDGTFGESVFDRIINLPINYTESVTMGTQLAKMRSLDSIREMFTGPMANILLELPSAVIFLVAIVILAGNIVWIPIAMMVVLALLTYFTKGIISRAVHRTATFASYKQAFLIEALDKHAMIKLTASGSVWEKRFKKITAKHAMANYHSTLLSQGLGDLSNMLMLISGVAVIALGAFKVINGLMTAGALFATMMVVWRALSPMRLCFTSLCQLSQAKGSINQVNKLMRLPSENHNEHKTACEVEQGEIEFKQVSYRYPNTIEPSLISAGFKINNNDFVMIYGQASSGKSTLLKLLLRLYSLQSGSICIAGKDIRQYSPKQLRQSIAYVPQVPHMFYGTIFQNFRLANPLATDEKIKQACKSVGVYDDIMQLEDDFETRFGDQQTATLSPDFMQQLSLARALVKGAPILLLDEPTNGLGAKSVKRLFSTLKKLSGKITIIILTNNIQQVKHADSVICLSGGRVTYRGAPDKLYAQLAEG